MSALAAQSGSQFQQLADRTSDVVLLCDAAGLISYASTGRVPLRLHAGASWPAPRFLTWSIPMIWRTRCRPPRPSSPVPSPAPGALPAGSGRPTAPGGMCRRPCRAYAEAGRARSAARHGTRHQRSGRAAPAGHSPHLPRRADRPAEPLLPGGASQGPARQDGSGTPGADRADRGDLRRPRRLHRDQRLGRSRSRRPRARPGWPAAARPGACARHGGPVGRRRVRRADRERRRPAGDRRHRRAACRRDRGRAVPGRGPGHVDHRQPRGRVRRSGRGRAFAAQRRPGHVQGEGRRRRPGRGLRRAHARGRHPAPGAGQRTCAAAIDDGGLGHRVPAGGGAVDLAGGQRRGAGPVVAGGRADHACRVPGHRRGLRADRAARRLGAGPRPVSRSRCGASRAGRSGCRSTSRSARSAPPGSPTRCSPRSDESGLPRVSADAGGDRAGADRDRRAGHGPDWPGYASSASDSRSTTSAPATRRWPTCASCRSTSSRSTRRSWPASAPTARWRC